MTVPAPPHNLDAERAVLGAMLLDNAVIFDVLDAVRREDFYHVPHQLVFDGIIAVHREGNPVDLTLVIDRLRRSGTLDDAGGVIAVAGLEQFVMATGGAAALAQVVRDKAIHRALMQIARRIYTEASAETFTPTEALEKAQKELFDLAMNDKRDEAQSIGELWNPVLDIVEARKNPTNTFGISTGLRAIDNRFRISPTSLTIVGARPSIGKTAFAVNLAYNIAWLSQRKVLFFSMEMSKEELEMRFICLKTDIPAAKLQRPEMLTDFELSSARREEQFVKDSLSIHIDATPHLTIANLTNKCRRFATQHRDLGLIIVDYLGLMAVDRTKGSNRNLELGELTRGMKILAMDLRVPVVALQQLSRDVEKRGTEKKRARPRLSDLRESGRIEEDADNVLFLHRERQRAGDDDPHARLIVDCEIIIAKQRNGPIFDANVLFDLSVGAFRDQPGAGPND